MKRSRDIAVIGMSGRFPGAADLTEFWLNLRDGVESITPYTDQELLRDGAAPEELANPLFVKAGSHLADIDLFDAAFFGINPREAESMDPQQRLFLECSWHALEDGGYDPHAFSGSIGVFAGCAMSSYLYRLYQNPKFMSLVGYLQVLIGNDKDYLTTHVSYKLDLKGPSVSVQSTCSTSLTAIAMACRSLQQGDCDMALAGGVCVRVPQKTGYYHEPGGIYSPDGHCRVFDAEGEGVVFGSGVGVVLLKPLAAALGDGDAVHAVVRGSAINNDGALKASYTAPGLEGQTAVIAAAQRAAGLSPGTIRLIEAHGTGTPLGDPIEIAALTTAFRRANRRKGFCAVGSVKSNVGHLDHAAGVAGFMKAVLALEHRMLPPSLNCDQPNPRIDFESSPFYVNRTLRPWEADAHPRRAGISGFGIGGTNVHVIVEEAPQRPVAPAGGDRSAHLLVLSARSSAALQQVTTRLAEHLVRHPDLRAADVAYTLQAGRRSFAYRRALVCRDLADAVSNLTSLDGKRVATGVVSSKGSPVAFMFSGQGAQYVNMARGIYLAEPSFRAIVDECSERLREALGLDLRELLYPPAGQERPDLLRETRLTQPALFVLEYALARLLMDWGIAPDAMIGHSIGEYVVACLAGCFSLEDGLRLVAERGRLMQEQPHGSMLAVFLPEEEALSILNGELDLAAINAESQCVVSGETPAIAALEGRLAAAGLAFARLETSHAFHSRMMEPALRAFRDVVASIPLKPPAIRWVSTLTGTWMAPEEATSPDYWARQLREPVRFADAVRVLLTETSGVLLEVGPGEALSRMARRAAGAVSDKRALASLPPAESAGEDVEFLLNALGRLWVAGVAVNWTGVNAKVGGRRVHLPTYPFERQRFWVAAPEEEEALQAMTLKNGDIGEWFYTPSWKYSVAPDPKALPETLCWVVFKDVLGLGAEVISRLEAQGQYVIAVSGGTEFRRSGDRAYEIDSRERAHYVELFRDVRGSGKSPARIVHFWTISGRRLVRSDEETIAIFQDRGFYSVLSAAQALIALNVTTPVRIDVVSDKMHMVNGDEPLNPAVSTVLGVCRSLPQEYANIRCRSIDVVLPAEGGSAFAALADQLTTEVASDRLDPTIAYRSGQRWVQVYEQERFEEPTLQASLLRDNGVYLLTGGLGHIPMCLANELATTVQARLAIVGRSKFPPRAEWRGYLATHPGEDETSRRIRQLIEFEQYGVDFMVLRADVSDEWEVGQAVDRVYARYGAIHGVIHGAGNVSAAGFFGIDQADRTLCERQFAAKVQGLVTLERVLQSETLDFWLLLSSISSALAGLGYVAYSAANAFMDALAAERTAATGVPWLSVNWDTWDFAEGLEFDPGHAVILPDEGAECFQRLAAWTTPPRVIVSVSDLYTRLDQWINMTGPAKAVEVAAGSHLHKRPETGTNYVAPRNDVERRIAAVWQDLLGVSEVGIHDDFFTELSGSSLLAAQLVTQLRSIFQKELPLRRFFDEPTVAALAALFDETAAAESPAASERAVGHP